MPRIIGGRWGRESSKWVCSGLLFYCFHWQVVSTGSPADGQADRLWPRLKSEFFRQRRGWRRACYRLLGFGRLGRCNSCRWASPLLARPGLLSGTIGIGARVFFFGTAGGTRCWVRKVAAALPHRAAQQGRNRLNLLFLMPFAPVSSGGRRFGRGERAPGLRPKNSIFSRTASALPGFGPQNRPPSGRHDFPDFLGERVQ